MRLLNAGGVSPAPLLLVLLLIGVVVVGAVTPDPAPRVESAAVIPTLTPIYPPGREPIPYPVGYRDTRVHYLTVDRADGVTRNVFISPQAVEAAGRGERIPNGTFIVIEAFEAQRDLLGQYLLDEMRRFVPGDLRVDEIHVGERRSTWRIEDTHANTNFDGWNFAAFDFDTGERITRNLNECFNCHDQSFRTEFLFTRDQLDAFARTGEVQYFYCPRPARIPCRVSTQRQSSTTDSGA